MKLIMLTGAIATGVEEILEEVLKNEGVHMVIPTITRTPLENEVDGQYFKFVTEEKFQELLDNNEFIDARMFQDKSTWYGGITKDSVDTESDNTYVAALSVQGAKAFKEYLMSLETENPISVEIVSIYCNDRERMLRILNSNAELSNTEVLNICNEYIQESAIMEKFNGSYDLILKNESVSDFRKCVNIISGLINC